MSDYRNYTLEEIEKDRIAYRRIPAHYGKTYTEVKAERAQRKRKIKVAALIAGGVGILAWAVFNL